MKKIQILVGAVYSAFSSWQTSNDRDMRGFSAAGLLGVLTFFLAAAIVKRTSPVLISEWLQLPGFLKLLLPATFVGVVASFLQWHRRGWRWAEDAQREAPHLFQYRQLLAISVVLVVITILVLSYVI